MIGRIRTGRSSESVHEIENVVGAFDVGVELASIVVITTGNRQGTSIRASDHPGKHREVLRLGCE